MVDKNVVWVLGSGFSKSLGGPMLNELLTERGMALTQQKLPKTANPIVYRIYQNHFKGTTRRDKPIYWADAEEFLNYVDVAARDEGPIRAILAPLVREATGQAEDLGKFFRDAVKAVATECLFTTHSSTSLETWGPYTQWAKSLGSEKHTVLTFNYDLVLEELGEHDPKNKLGQSTVWLPAVAKSGDDASEQDAAEMAEAGMVKILKLHGSVNWFRSRDGKRISFSDTPLSDMDEGAVPVIATPGPSKVLHQQETFKELWAEGVKALKEADVVVFLGYRFPPSDAESRRVILNALKENGRGKGEHYLRIHTVLGPDVNHEHSVRLKFLLRETMRGADRQEFTRLEEINPYAGRTFSVSQQPLYVEDFLTISNRRLLYGG